MSIVFVLASETWKARVNFYYEKISTLGWRLKLYSQSFIYVPSIGTP